MFKKAFFSSVLSLSCLSSASSLFALPEGGTTGSGNVTFDYSVPGALTITSTSDRSIVNWDSFSIDTSESTTITLPSSTSAILNRVTGTTASNLLGSLQSNGTVYLINQNGVIFGVDATINTNSFLASTLDTLDSDFLSGGDMNFTGNIGAGATVINYGTIQVADGDVILLGYQVVNDSNLGTITASSGTIALGAGQQIAVQPASSERIVIFPGGDSFANVTGLDNAGSLNSLIAELKADGNPYALAISHDPSGSVNASGPSSSQSGLITLRADGGVVEINGPITSQNSDSTGGTVYILGDTITLDSNCYIDTSADQGGGPVFVGGSFNGADGTIPNATDTTFTADAAIYTSAYINHDGGQVVVWADNSVTFCGQVYANSGYISGNGGTVEFGGTNYLQFAGGVSNLNSDGSNGMLILDSNNIVYTPCN